MAVTDSRLRLAEQGLAAHKARLASAADKDTVRRQIKAMEVRIAAIKAESAQDPRS